MCVKHPSFRICNFFMFYQNQFYWPNIHMNTWEEFYSVYTHFTIHFRARLHHQMGIIRTPTDLNLFTHIGQCYTTFLSFQIYFQLLFTIINKQSFYCISRPCFPLFCNSAFCICMKNVGASWPLHTHKHTHWKHTKWKKSIFRGVNHLDHLIPHCHVLY